MSEREEHQEIWLQPYCADCERNDDSDTGRTWCQDQVYETCAGCGREPVRYVLARALRAYAEREKELVEALEPFADFFDWSEKGAPARGGLRKTDFAKARAILSKHKEQT